MDLVGERESPIEADGRARLAPFRNCITDA